MKHRYDVLKELDIKKSLGHLFVPAWAIFDLNRKTIFTILIEEKQPVDTKNIV